MTDEIFTVAQAAQNLQVCEKTVRRHIISNKLAASCVGTGNHSLTDIDIYLDEHANKARNAETGGE